jgi:hypothetical protein
MVDVVLLEDLVAELSASLEGKELGLGERVVAVEENVVNLVRGTSVVISDLRKLRDG